MKILIERNTLLSALGHVTSVVERRTTIPILSNVLLSAADGSLELKATDLEREVVETTDADVAQAGSMTVPAHIIHEIVRKLSDGAQISLELNADDGRLNLSSGHANFTLQTLPGDEFPDLSADEMEHHFELPAKDLRRLIEKVRFAISTEETRYYLNGIYFHTAESDGKQVLRAVATDGHRLAQVELDMADGAENIPGVIIPRKTIHEIHRLIEDVKPDVKIALSTSKIQFRIGSVVVTSKLIDGTFPDYGRVIPEGNDKILNVSSDDFAKAVDRVSTISNERGRAVKLNITSDNLVLSVSDPNGGSATEELSVNYDADPLEIGFNARYLLDITNQLESDTVHFLLSDPGSPIYLFCPLHCRQAVLSARVRHAASGWNSCESC